MAVDSVWRELVINLIEVIILVFIIKYLWTYLYINNIMPGMAKRKKKK